MIMLFFTLTGRSEWSNLSEWTTIAVELCAAIFAAAGTGVMLLLIFLPVHAARLLLCVPGKKVLWKRLTIFVPFVPAFIAVILVHGLFRELLCSTVAGALVALFILVYLREEEKRLVPIKQSLANKDAILSTLSHEIRTPLTVIQSTIDIMTEGRTGELNTQQQQFLSSVESNVRRLVSLSDTILASIKVESDWFTVNLHSIDIRRVIKDVATHMQPVLEEKDQRLRYSFPKLLSKPLADENWIHQVLVNLVHNAVKHLQREGTIQIHVNENEQGIAVSVSDNGSGIKTKERLKVFDEYFQGDGYSVTNLDGAGLGLSIVKRVVEKHNGKIYFGSVKGLGTSVVFTLPTERSRELVEKKSE